MINNSIEEQVRFCAKFLLTHGITTPEKYSLLLGSLQPTDPNYEMVRINNDDSVFIDMANQLKQLWPTGTREINGRRYPWQDSAKNITIRLKQLWNARGFGEKYTVEDVLQCARQYLSDYESDATYMLSLPYWISKEKTITDTKGKTKKVYVSKMADALESKTDDDWTSTFSGYLGEGDLI